MKENPYEFHTLCTPCLKIHIWITFKNNHLSDFIEISNIYISKYTMNFQSYKLKGDMSFAYTSWIFPLHCLCPVDLLKIMIWSIFRVLITSLPYPQHNYGGEQTIGNGDTREQRATSLRRGLRKAHEEGETRPTMKGKRKLEER